MEMKDSIEVVCECVGRCGVLHIEKYDDDIESMWDIQYFIPARYAREVGLKDTLKLIWALITGKKYWIYDIILNKQQIEKLKGYLDKW